MELSSSRSSNQSNNIKVCISLSMLYMCIMLCNAILTNRYVGFDSCFILGGTLTSPLIFILDGVIAEIYGFKTARFIIIVGYISQTLFSLICLAVTKLPFPSISSYETLSAYKSILGSSLLKIDICGCIAYISANIMNCYLLTRWKVLLKGKMFWLRSIGASFLSEGLYTLIAISLMEIQLIPTRDMYYMILLSFMIKMFYSGVFAYPTQLLVIYLKEITGSDYYTENNIITPRMLLTKELEVK